MEETPSPHPLDPNHDGGQGARAPVVPAAPASPAGEAGPAATSPRPRRPRVFGRFAFFICVVPYLTYLLGTWFANYLDQSRAHNHIQRQRGRTAAMFEAAVGQLRSQAVGDDVKRRLESLDLTKLKDVVAVQEEIETDAIESVTAPFLSQSSPIPPEMRTVLQGELDFLFELVAADKKHLYRDVLEKGYQRQLRDHQEEIAVGTSSGWFPANRTWYPTLYPFTVALTTLMMLIAFPGYFKAPFRFSWLSVAVGIVGIVVWIGLWLLDRDVLHWFNRIEARAAFNPFEELKEHPLPVAWFLGVRLFGLVLVVPIIEEFFLRGFLMRYIDDPDWDEVPLGTAGKWAILGVFIYAGFTHPSEAIAALAWFGMVTWLYLKTGSIWNCVIAHSITNLLLAAYVLWREEWALW